MSMALRTITVNDLCYDLFGVVYSCLSPKAQAALRSTCTKALEDFCTAVRSEVFIGCAYCLRPDASLDDYTCEWAPFNSKTAHLLPPGGTAVAHPSFVVEPTTNCLPDQFFSSCTAAKIVVASSSEVEEFGGGCFGWCCNLVHIEFHRMLKLKRIGRGFLSHCSHLVSVDFRGLESVVEVGLGWMYCCRRLTLINFTGMFKLETVGYGWLGKCRCLSVVDFGPLSSLREVGRGSYSGNTYWMGDCPHVKATSLRKPPKIDLPQGLPN